MMRRCLPAFLLLGVTALATAPFGATAHAAAGQIAKDDIAAQIRIQGQRERLVDLRAAHSIDGG